MDYKISWKNLSERDKSMALMNATKTAGMVLEGTGKTAKDVNKYINELLEHQYSNEPAPQEPFASGDKVTLK